MKFIKWQFRWEEQEIKTPIKRTFWQLICRSPRFSTKIENRYVRYSVEFESLTKLLEDVASNGPRGYTCECMLDLGSGKDAEWFTVDKGRNKLAIQCSAINSQEAKRKLRLFKDLLEEDMNGMLFDIADKNGKTYEVVFNVVDRSAHSEYNRKFNTGG